MKRLDIDTAREIRLWIRDVVVPAGIAATVILSNQNVRDTLTDKVKATKDNIRNIFEKK